MSDTIKKRVGLGTAYGFAKAGGYEGTVEQFTELLGNIAIDLARIENLSVTVTTLPAGSQATASLNGSVLSLGIPKGDKGDKGNTGNTPDFGIGTVTTLSAGSSATASITGTAENPVLNLGIPEGQAGSGAVGTVASAYSASKTYAVGDYVIHNSNLYRCTTAITTAEAFTAAHWTQVVLGDDVSDLKSENREIENAIGFNDTTINTLSWENAIPDASTGVPASSAARICTNKFAIPAYARSLLLTIENGYKCAWYAYGSDGTFLDKKFWLSTADNAIKIKDTWAYLIVGLANTSDSAISPSAASNITVGFSTTMEDLKTEVVEMDSLLIERSNNIFDHTYSGTVKGVAFTNGRAKDYHPTSAGEFVSAVGEIMSYPIEVEVGKTVYTYRLYNSVFSLSSISRCAFLDESYNYVEGSYVTGVNHVTVPSGAKYVVFSSTDPAWMCFGENVPTVVSYKGDLTEYEAYFPTKAKVAPSDLVTLSNNLTAKMNGFNSTQYEVGYDWQSKVSAFCALFNDTENIETYCFFTDPHLFKLNGGFQMDTFEPYMSILQKVFNSSPCDFIMCGGDWLNNGDTKAQACFNLGYVDGVMSSMFKRWYIMVGNHDTNYQGYDYVQDNTKYRDCMLSDDTIRNLWFRDEGERYYSFDGNNCKYYVLDTGIDWWDWITDDRKAQMDWLAAKLIADDPTHTTIFMHITLNAYGVLGENAKGIGKMITAFNNHTRSESINGTYYDFTGTTGHIDYVMSGHTHYDSVSEIGGVPLIVTTNFTDGNTPTFDLVLVNYESGVVNLIRVGTGSNRTVSFV